MLMHGLFCYNSIMRHTRILWHLCISFLLYDHMTCIVMNAMLLSLVCCLSICMLPASLSTPPFCHTHASKLDPPLCLIPYVREFEEGLAKVTHDQNSVDQSDLTTQNLGSNHCVDVHQAAPMAACILCVLAVSVKSQRGCRS